MIKLRIISILFSLTIFLFGCSSGEWDGPTGEQRDPMVLQVIPPSGGNNVGTGDNIVAFFNRDMDPSTVNMGNYYVVEYNEYHSATVGTTDGTVTTYGVMPPKIPGNYSYDASQRAAIFSPRYLGATTTYLVIVETGMKDSTGRAMLTGYRWWFTTGTW